MATETQTVDDLIKRLFRVRHIALRAGFVLAAILIAAFFDEYACLLTEPAKIILLIIPCLVTLFVILISSVVICYYMFKAGWRGIGLGYAIGHVLIFLWLLGIFFLGVILVPLLIRRDFERLGLIDAEYT